METAEQRAQFVQCHYCKAWIQLRADVRPVTEVSIKCSECERRDFYVVREVQAIALHD